MIGPIVGVRGHRLLEGGDRFIALPAAVIGVTQIAIGFVGVRRQFQCPAQFGDRFRVLPGGGIDAAQRDVNFGQVVRKPFGLLRGERRLLCPNTLFGFTVHPQAGVGESGVSQSEVGVFIDGLLEQRHGGPNSVGVVTVAQDISPLQIKIVGLHVLRGVGADARLLFVRRLEGKGRGHVAVDLILEGEHIARGTRELLAPDALAGGGIVETEGDAELVAIALHTALQHQVDAEFAGELGERWIFGGCLLNGVRGCDVHFLQLKQLGGESFLNAVGHVTKGFLISDPL